MPNPLVRLLASLALALLPGSPAFAIDSGDIVIASVKGEVRVTMNGAMRAVRGGTVLELPATVETGRDGAIDLKQGATSISVGPDTRLEFPALEKRRAPVDRIVQPRGNAFYDIGKREGRKLRVETPYLVGVIKGTQFNVAAQEGSTTISLFEGRLEVRAADDSSVVDLAAGEVASLRSGDKSINVIKMDQAAPATAPRSQKQNGEDGDKSGTARLSAHGGNGASLVPLDEAGIGADAVIGVRVDAVADPEIDARPVGADTDARASVDVGGGSPAVDLGVAAGADVTPVVSVDTAVDGSIDAGVATDVAVGAVDTAVDVAAGADLGANGAGAVVDVGAAAGVGDVAAVDTSVELGANLGAGAVDVGANVDVGVSVPGVDAGVGAGVDVGAGAVDLGLTIGDVDVDLGVDLGLDDGNNGHGNDPGRNDPTNPGNTNNPTAPPANIIEDVGGLLDGLLRGPKRR